MDRRSIFNAKNVYGKEDTMITIQWDALLAEQFDMYYIDENGDKETSVHHPPYIYGMLRKNTCMAD